jgi:hypothetical protein
MTVTTNRGSSRWLKSALRAAALAGVSALLVACGGDSDCNSPPAFEGEPVGECDGGGGTERPTASDLTLVLSSPSLPNNGTSEITATVTAVNANRNALPGIPVTVRVNNGAVAKVDGSATNEAGAVTAEIGVGDNSANRTVTVTATSGGVTRSATFQVVGATLTATPLPAVIAPGAQGQVDFRLVDVTAKPMAGQNLTITGVDSTPVNGQTDINGNFVYTYTAPVTAGTLNIRAAGGGTSLTQTVLVQSGTGTIPPADIAVQSASVAASPSVVSVNTGSTTNRAEVRALFLGDGNQPVKNVRVRFSLNDLSGVPGSLTSGSNVVYTDSNGIATTAYIPGSRLSPTDGVTIKACWSANDFDVAACPSDPTTIGSPTTTVTVISEALSVSVGTDSLIEIVGQTYVKTYTVQVVDSSGLAKAGVQVSPSVDLTRYFKGTWNVVGDKWVRSQLAACDNEDLNRNGVLQVYSNGNKEDANLSGALDPRKADVAISFVGSPTTNSDGQVKLKLTYLQNAASWIEYNILIAAGGVAGTEGRTNYQDLLPVPAAAISDVVVMPAFQTSPYGIQASGTVVATNPLNPAQTGNLCTNKN